VAISCNPQDLVTAARCFFCVKQSSRQAVKTYLLCQYALKGVTVGDLVANAWALRVVANGGPMPSQNSINASVTFVNSLNTAGVWSKMLDVNMFAPDSLIASITPLLITDGFTLWTNTNFVAGDITVNGLQGNAGAGKFLDTGINSHRFTTLGPGVFPGLSLYITTNIAGNFCEMSYIQNQFSLYPSFGGTTFFDCYGTTTGRLSAAAAAVNFFFSGNRTSVTNNALYKANSGFPFAQIASTAANNTILNVNDATHIFVFANNNGGNVPLQISNRTVSFAAYHFGLNASDCQTLFNAVQALRTSFGGGFV
jgi:hypothetical protein